MATPRRWTRCFACGAGHVSPSLGSRCPYISSEILAHICLILHDPLKGTHVAIRSPRLFTPAPTTKPVCPCGFVPDHGRNSGSVYVSTRGHTIEVRVRLNTPDHFIQVRDTDSTQQYRASPTGWLQAHQRSGTDVESTSIKTISSNTNPNHFWKPCGQTRSEKRTTRNKNDHACRHCRPDHG